MVIAEEMLAIIVHLNPTITNWTVILMAQEMLAQKMLMVMVRSMSSSFI